MEFKKTRVKQIITALGSVKNNFEQLQNEEIDDIKEFYLMSIKDNLNMIDDYLKSLVADEPDNIDKLQADYNNLLARYRALKIRHNNLVENIRESEKQTRFSLFSRWELNSIALALKGFNNEHNGIINAEDYQRLLKEIRKEEEIQKSKREAIYND